MRSGPTIPKMFSVWGLALIAGSFAALIVFVFWPLGTQDTLTCQDVTVRVGVAGSAVTGIEDFAVDAVRGRIVLSAYDRRTKAPGGLYAVDIAALLDPRQRVMSADPLGAPTWPHGITVVNEQAKEMPTEGAAWTGLYVINRPNPEQHLDPNPQIDRLFADGAFAPFVTGQGVQQSFCNANDLVALDDGILLATNDRAACTSYGRLAEDVLNQENGSVVRLTSDTSTEVAAGIGFANGIAADRRFVYVAATRARRLLIFDRLSLETAQGPEAPLRSIRLSGAPDNLSWGDDGKLYIAAHTNLIRFALFRLWNRLPTATRILRYDPETEAVTEVGYRSGTGAAVGATVASAIDGKILLGGGFAPGLARCQLGLGVGP